MDAATLMSSIKKPPIMNRERSKKSLTAQMHALLSKINANQLGGVLGDGPQKAKSPLSLALAGINPSIYLNPADRPGFRSRNSNL